MTHQDAAENSRALDKVNAHWSRTRAILICELASMLFWIPVCAFIWIEGVSSFWFFLRILGNILCILMAIHFTWEAEINS